MQGYFADNNKYNYLGEEFAQVEYAINTQVPALHMGTTTTTAATSMTSVCMCAAASEFDMYGKWNMAGPKEVVE